jgi:hypothetical protein
MIERETILFQRSGRLFANPSFMTGMAKVFDIGAVFDVYNNDPTPEAADFYAMLSDWCAVGDDLRSAIKNQEVSS